MQPKVPLVQPEVPLVQPKVPLVQPEVPLVQPKVPLVQPEVPLVQPEVPLVQPKVPLVQPEVPSRQPYNETSKQQSSSGQKKNASKQLNSDEVRDEADTNVCTAGNTYFIEIKLGKKRCSGLLDTGSEVTLLPKHLADLSQINRSSRKLKAANGTQINIVGEWRTIVKKGPLNVTMNFIVSDQIDEILIGIDWLREHRCLLSFAELTITLYDYCFPMKKEVHSGSCIPSISEEEVIIPAESGAVIPGKVVYSNLRKTLPSVFVADNNEGRPGVRTARCLSNCVAHVEKCATLEESNINNVVRNMSVRSLREMPKKKTKTSSEAERKDKEHACPECKKPFLRKTDADRHFEMKHFLVKRECRHCGAVLGSVSALRRHLEKQHQVKLSTRPDILDPERWKMTPLGGNPNPERVETSEGGGNTSRDTLTVRSVLTDVGTSGGSASASLVPATSVARPAVPAGSATPLGFGDSDGYLNPEDAGQTENHPPTVERFRGLIPSDQGVLEGSEQLREWRKELIAALRPIC